MMSIETIGSVASFGGLALMFGIESLFPSRAWKDPRWYRFIFHIGLGLFNTIILRFTVLIPLVIWQQFVYSKGWGIAPMLGLNGLAEILIGLVVLDYFDYWWHRLNHLVPFFWRFHKVHHVDTHLDVTTATRFHPGELALSTGAKAIWIVIWGPTLLAFAIFEAGIGLAAKFHHTNISIYRPIEKWIRKIFVTPRFHLSHHTVSQRSREANFSTIFIFWDKISKTYQEPNDQEMEHIGLPGGREKYLSLGATLRAPFTKEY